MDQTCALWIDQESPFGFLLETLNELKKAQCSQGIFMILGEAPQDLTQWDVPFPCPKMRIQ